MPSISNLRAPDKYLTNFSLSVGQNLAAFQTVKSIPTIPVQLQSGIYRIFEADALRDIKVAPVAPGTQTVAGDFGYGKGQYHAELRGLHVDLDPVTRSNATDISLEKDATNYLTTQMLLEQERRFSETFLTTGVWSRDLVGGAQGRDGFLQFDDAKSKPIQVLRDAMLSSQLESGYAPNKMWISRRVFNTLLEHPDVIDRINRGQTTGPAIANSTALAAILNLDQVIVLDAITKSADGKNTRLGDNTILLAYSDTTAGPNSVTSMAQFSWVGLNQYLTQGNAVIKMNHPLLDGTIRLENKYADHMVVVSKSLGVLMTNVLAASER